MVLRGCTVRRSLKLTLSPRKSIDFRIILITTSGPVNEVSNY